MLKTRHCNTKDRFIRMYKREEINMREERGFLFV